MRKSGKAQATSASSIPRTTTADSYASHPQVEPFKSRRYDKKQVGCYIKNAVKTAPVWEKMSTFAKISAHNERFLLNNSYLCAVVPRKGRQTC